MQLIITTLTTKELVALLDLGKDLQAQIALKALNKISDLIPMQASAIAERFDGSIKDNWLNGALQRFEHLTTNELLSMLKVSYSSQTQLAMMSIDKLNDLTPENAVLIANKLSGSSKDNWLKAVLEKQIKLSIRNHCYHTGFI